MSADERGAMMASYPGDPLARAEGVYVTLKTNDFGALDEWFKAALADRAARFYPDNDLLSVEWAKLRMQDRVDMEVIYFVKEKRDVMLIRLAFG